VTFLNISPYLYYDDAGAALEWLGRVFGFGNTRRYLVDGRVEEAEIEVGPVTVMLSGRAPGPQNGPGALLIVHVDDVEEQYQRVRAAGVDADPPEDKSYGPRTFHVIDPWGYTWSFWQGEAIYPS
jgi:uncharacterized glyoxalase superfamily protein PhnB